MKSATTPYRVVFLDDHPIVSDGLAALLGKSAEFESVGSATEPDGFLRLVEEKDPAVAVVDLSLEKGDGLNAVRELRERFPSLAILVCSMHDENLFAERALKAGANGYVMKREVVESFLGALRAVAGGKTWLTSRMMARVVKRATDGRSDSDSSLGNLTDREMQVLLAIGDGFSSSAMAEKFLLSVKTVDAYKERLKKKLKLKSVAELTRYAVVRRREMGNLTGA